ncbi:hypothetical protein LTR37_019957 [Vermiconidia calcicola]|uniref:Uncharacterized protein n=1 Tax=Vermiconidia calcicola TaxID=1690605 RepID=A0ACC3MCT7_9PEZI|nr:hypothetical protein LTR37_019957 [Vermiconidia calcicola]
MEPPAKTPSDDEFPLTDEDEVLAEAERANSRDAAFESDEDDKRPAKHSLKHRKPNSSGRQFSHNQFKGQRTAAGTSSSDSVTATQARMPDPERTSVSIYEPSQQGSQSTDMTTTGLLDLPAELVAHLFTYLDTDSLFATRLTSKHLESASFSYFGRRFFRKKGFLITPDAMLVLNQIAAHQELRKYVEHLWFNPDCYTFVRPPRFPDDAVEEGEDSGVEGEERPRRPGAGITRAGIGAYKNTVARHEHLLYGPQLGYELASAFRCLPNLAVVGMRRSEDHEPWGRRKYQRLIGEDPRVLGPIPSGSRGVLSGPTMLFTAIVHAAAAPKRTELTRTGLKRLYTDAVEIDNLHPEHIFQDKLNAACRDLLYLEINASKGSFKRGTPAEYGQGLLRLFQAVPHLRELGLQIFPDLAQPVAGNAEAWRKAYSYIAFQRIVEGVQLTNLTRLKLEKITTTPEILKAFISASRTSLMSLKMRYIRLLSPPGTERPWQKIFEFLRDSCSNLAYLLLYNLMYEFGGIAFVEETPASKPVQVIQDPEFNPGYTDPGTEQFFAQYEHIALEAKGRDEVEKKFAEVVDGHWYRKPIISYAMDESLWHTDTSDEE